MKTVLPHSEKKHKRRLRQLQKLLKASSLCEKRNLIRKEIKNTKVVWKAFWEAYLENNKIGEVLFPTTEFEPDHALDERFALPA